MIVAEHLRKTFPGKGKDKTPVIAVDDVGFTAHDGQITGLLGPNGAGKTTTMRMLYTLMTPETGRVLWMASMWRPIPTACAAAWAYCRTRAACTSD